MAQSMRGISPSMLAKQLEGAIFPAWKQDLVARARDNGAEGELREAIESLPERQYDDLSEVAKAVGGGEDSSRQTHGSPQMGRPTYNTTGRDRTKR